MTLLLNDTRKQLRGKHNRHKRASILKRRENSSKAEMSCQDIFCHFDFHSVSVTPKLLDLQLEIREGSVECTILNARIRRGLDSVRHYGQYHKVCDVREIVFL